MKRPLLWALFLVVPLAYAHGDKKHPPAAEAAAEQMAWGIAGKLAQVNRTLILDMTDAMRFTPDAISVVEGDTVRFVVRNTGRMLHELVIGTPNELAKHAAMMVKFPGMEHDAPYMVHVDPGKTGEMVWHFNRAGRFEFACLIAGHHEAGMRGTLTVTPNQGVAK